MLQGASIMVTSPTGVQTYSKVRQPVIFSLSASNFGPCLPNDATQVFEVFHLGLQFGTGSSAPLFPTANGAGTLGSLTL